MNLYIRNDIFKYKYHNRYVKMGIFNNNEQYQTLIERYQEVLLKMSEIQQDIILLRTQVSALSLENNDLRDKVLRKIQKNKTPEDTELKSGQKYRG